jgi:hypothetical protein
MEKKFDKIKKLDSLLCLTDTALFYAQKNDIVGVSRCVVRRRAILEELKIFQNISHNLDHVKVCIKKLLKKDLELQKFLQAHREEIKRKKDNCSKIRKLKMRFSGKNPFTPKFIDRKI